MTHVDLSLSRGKKRPCFEGRRLDGFLAWIGVWWVSQKDVRLLNVFDYPIMKSLGR